jgi:Tol biopolymer transport system component
LLVLGADGSIQKALPWEKDAVSGASWLDNENVVINIAGANQSENQGIKPDTLLVLNPFTGKRQIRKPDYPNLYDGYPLPFWSEPWGRSISVYNPRLSHVVYLSEGGYTYVLWDVNKKKEVKRLLHWNIASDEQPRWSPDGSKFVMSAYLGDTSSWPQPADGLYLVDTQGNTSKLLSTNRDSYILDHIWSPSGRYIALLEGVNNPEIQQKKLLILDTQTLKIIDTCVEYHSLTQSDTPIWSPDETQLLLYDNTKEHSQVILVDLVKHIAFPIADDMEPRGWMKSP